MPRTFELMPIDNRKSFYGKATVIEDGEKAVLLSYGTPVAMIKNGNFYRLWDGYSVTTTRHINAFLSTYGINGGGKKWLENISVTKMEAF